MTDALLLLLIALVVLLLVVVLARRPGPGGDGNLALPSSEPMNRLSNDMRQALRETAVLSEKLAGIERSVSQVNQSVANVHTGVATSGTNTEGLLASTNILRAELARAKESIAELHAQAQSRKEVDLRMAESIRRLEMVIAGTNSKGTAGENLLEAVFAQLPPDWQARDVTVNGKTCEFGLRLPNRLLLPIDSKWAATPLLEEFVGCDDVGEQRRIKGEIERRVLAKAREVKKYIEPSRTVNFAVAVVPDAVYDLCGSCICEAFREDVVIVSRGMFVPYLLLVFQTVLKTSQTIDVEKLDRELRFAEKIVEQMRKELDGRLSRAIAMLSNCRDDMGKDLGKLRGSLVSLQVKDADSLPAGGWDEAMLGDGGDAAPPEASSDGILKLAATERRIIQADSGEF